MDEFVNRSSTNSNRRELNVVSCVTDSGGNPKKLIVDIARGDSNVNATGTKLDAQNLKKAIIGTIMSEIYGITYSGDLTVDWVGNNTNSTFNIYLKGLRLYGESFNYYNYSMQVNNTDPNVMRVNVTGKNLSEYKSIISIDLDLKLYSDATLKQFVTKLKITGTYTPDSSYPSD